jgi:RNA polymerase sigma-70 factor, ECF subfamily
MDAGTPDPDVALMRRVKSGDREAFTALVEKYRQPILNLTYRMVGDLGEAEDLAQTAFVQVYRFAQRYREDARFSTWLYTIARNLCLNEIRRRQRHPTDSLESARDRDDDRGPHQMADIRSPSPPEELLRAELEEKVQQALNSLPPKQRLAVLLCRDSDLSYEDIANVLRCSVSATKSLIHRGRETLKKRLKPYLRTGVWETPDAPEQL